MDEPTSKSNGRTSSTRDDKPRTKGIGEDSTGGMRGADIALAVVVIAGGLIVCAFLINYAANSGGMLGGPGPDSPPEPAPEPPGPLSGLVAPDDLSSLDEPAQASQDG